jgi:Zn finger protein HypA/HybF involved in hydrogenase expression
MIYTPIPREQFLKDRAEGIAAAKAQGGPNVIVMDPEDEVVCDHCNAEIEEERIHVSDWGAACPECRADKGAA